MDPNAKVMIAELRQGKSGREALRTYCWAKCVVPISQESLDRYNGNAAACGPDLRKMEMAIAHAMDALDEGASDDEIEAEFNKGLAIDRDRGLLLRAMEKHERPTFGALVRSLPLESLSR